MQIAPKYSSKNKHLFSKTPLQVIEKACKFINSHKPNEFDIRFNPNLFQPIVKLADDLEQLHKDKSQLKEACEFLLTVQMPALVKDLLEHTIFVTDGFTLCETMHSRGINIRYLGHLMGQISQYETLSYLHSIGVNELVSRSCKRVFKQYIQSVASSHLSHAVAHFLNCFLSHHVKAACSGASGEHEGEAAESKSKKSKKKKNKANANKVSVGDQQALEWNALTTRSLWTQISEEAMAHYHYDIKM